MFLDNWKGTAVVGLRMELIMSSCRSIIYTTLWIYDGRKEAVNEELKLHTCQRRLLHQK